MGQVPLLAYEGARIVIVLHSCARYNNSSRLRRWRNSACKTGNQQNSWVVVITQILTGQSGRDLSYASDRNNYSVVGDVALEYLNTQRIGRNSVAELRVQCMDFNLHGSDNSYWGRIGHHFLPCSFDRAK
jgi:hypothetical protein